MKYGHTYKVIASKSAIRKNTIFVRYGHSVCTKQYTKNPNTNHAMKAEISMKKILFNGSVKRSGFSVG